jgi:hypothetical protein
MRAPGETPGMFAALVALLVERGLAPTVPRDAGWGERYCELRDPDGGVISLAKPRA